MQPTYLAELSKQAELTGQKGTFLCLLPFLEDGIKINSDHAQPLPLAHPAGDLL